MLQCCLKDERKWNNSEWISFMSAVWMWFPIADICSTRYLQGNASGLGKQQSGWTERFFIISCDRYRLYDSVPSALGRHMLSSCIPNVSSIRGFILLCEWGWDGIFCQLIEHSLSEFPKKQSSSLSLASVNWIALLFQYNLHSSM